MMICSSWRQLERELTRILGEFDTTVTLDTEAESETTELAAAKQSLTEEMQRLLGADFRRSTELVGGIPVDSEYIIFVIDTSGSMFNAAWRQVLQKSPGRPWPSIRRSRASRS